MSFARLQEKIDKMRNPTVVGLDPALEHIPPELLGKYIANCGETLEAAALAIIEFNRDLIDALCDIVPAVKPQMAFYEALGIHGMLALKFTCEYAKAKGMYVILDGKRGDIGSTAAAYSAAYLGAVKVGDTNIAPFSADALTVNAYLGSDGLRPFIEDAVRFDKAIFALVKTSNPSAGELQDRRIEDGSDDPKRTTGIVPVVPGSGDQKKTTRTVPVVPVPVVLPRSTVYDAVGDLIEEISRDTKDERGYTRVGAVVGATYPEEMKSLRERLKNTFFLVPGYGAQGGSAADAAHAFDENGRGAVVNSSRGIIAAWKKSGTHHAEAAREAAINMKDELCKELAKR